MVKGEALLFLAGHFFAQHLKPFNLLLALISGSNVLINASCFYERFFVAHCSLL